DTTANSAMDAGGTACGSMPYGTLTFVTGTGILNWTPTAAAVASVSTPTTYEFAVTGTDTTNLSNTVYYTVTLIKPWSSSIGFTAGSGAQYTYSSAALDFVGGLVELLGIDQTDDDNTSTGFGGSTFKGVVWDATNTLLRFGSNNGCDASSYNCMGLDSSWIPASSWANLAAYYPVDSNWNDAKGSNHGTTYGSASLSTTTKVGAKSSYFSGNGTSDYVVIPRALQDAFTISFWMKSTQDYDPGACTWWKGGALFDGDVSGDANDFGISLCAGYIRFGTAKADGSATYSIPSTIKVNDGVWHHIVMARNNTINEMYLYIDGVLDAQNFTTNLPLNGPADVYIGRGRTATTDFY
ncbi:MAG: LamG domain-containing protein, partial [Proteobacteria bacterium]